MVCLWYPPTKQTKKTPGGILKIIFQGTFSLKGDMLSSLECKSNPAICILGFNVVPRGSDNGTLPRRLNRLQLRAPRTQLEGLRLLYPQLGWMQDVVYPLGKTGLELCETWVSVGLISNQTSMPHKKLVAPKYPKLGEGWFLSVFVARHV